MRSLWTCLAAVVLLLGACASEDCSCGGGGFLFVELTTPQPGGLVEVCVDDDCVIGELSDVDGSANGAEVPLSELGLYDPQLRSGTPVTLTVIDRDGNELRSGTSVPASASNCCGVYWTVEL